MNTPSKEALDAAENVQDYLGFPRRATMDLAAIIDRHFEPLRQRLAEMESLLASEKTTRNAIIAKGQQTEARVKELEVSNSELRESHAAIYLALATLEADCSKWPDQIRALRAANAELANKLENCMGMLEELEDCDWGDCGMPFTIDWDSLRSVLARHAAGEPAKHPDTELIDEFASLCGSLEYCDADDMPSHWRASGYAGSHERAGSSLRDALRAAIAAARKEVQP